eukprot:gnl/Dysnectes_brevis/2556_a3075_885.p1 GENE.gnl/Dysnectes_brevis/2556_a3075_885~~gnl/Dysnectes_brevis/2556_a3075_885.p1  ORF type:complete len:487 (+),score=169.03 gnl/Dysnectes_brevis/2556_a3075_885:1284-2744(+)
MCCSTSPSHLDRLSLTLMFDLVVIGGGPGGYVAALRAAQLGMKVACIEKEKLLGGTCLREGCIPSKALLHSSHMYHEAIHSFPEHGISVENPKMDISKMLEQKVNGLTSLAGGIDHLFAKNGITRILGVADLLTPSQIQVSPDEHGLGEKCTVEAKNVLVATGSVVAELPFAPIDEDKIVSSTGALDFTEVPERLAVVGAGVIGLELGSVWARLGSKVTVVEYQDRILPGTDLDCAKSLQRSLQRNEKMKFKLNSAVSDITASEGPVSLQFSSRKSGKEAQLEVDKVLVSIGRRPNTQHISRHLGMSRNQWGYLEIDDTFQTSVPGVYAIGDCVPGPMLAHKAEEEGVACVEMLAGMGPKHVHHHLIPGVVYTSPELASVGMTEEQLTAEGVPFRSGSFPFSANSRAKAVGETAGLVKAIAHAETGELLGVHIVGSDASEMIHEAVVAMAMGAKAEEIGEICHAHPTLSEAVKEAMLATEGRAIHI